MKSIEAIRDWVLTLLLVAVNVVGGVAFHPFVWLAGRGTSSNRLDRVMSAHTRFALATVRATGIRLNIAPPLNSFPDGAVILVSNHQSIFDVVVISASVPDRGVRFVAKRSLAKGIPSVSPFLRSGRNALVDRGNVARSLSQIRRLGRLAVEEQVAVLIFPEGSRSRRGELAPFSPAGVAALMREAPHVPIVPVAIDGSWHMLERNIMPIRFGAEIRVEFGDPIPPEPNRQAPEVVEEARSWIAAKLAEWRQTSASSPPERR